MSLRLATFLSLLLTALLLATPPNASADDEPDWCSLSAGGLTQMLKASWSKRASGDPENAVWTCLEDRAILVADDLKTACKSSVAMGFETATEALARLTLDHVRKCLR